MRDRLILIDGDLFAYRFAAAAETATDWGEGQWTYHADEGNAARNMEAAINGISTRLEAAKSVVCLTEGENFRKKVLPSYKSNRADVRRPMILDALRSFLKEFYETKSKPGIEADDVMGIIMTNPKLYPNMDKVIVSQDKDMKTIPGLLYRDGKMQVITNEEAFDNFLIQTLSGDQADGYAGCPTVGPVKATRIVEQAEDKWTAVVASFTKQGLTEDDALVQARCARILHHSDWNYKTQEPIFWSPK